MKAASSLLSAVSAVALSTGLIMAGAGALQFATVVAAQAAVVSKIEVRGNRRIDAQTIRNYVAIRPGQSFSGADVDEAVKRLFGTGLFSDVRINQVGSTLVIAVDEYAIVNQVLFQGNRKVKDAELYRQIQLQPRGAFSQALVEADAETIRQAYARVGRDDTVVTPQVTEVGDGRVNVVFNVQEGGRTKIASIAFEGNSAYSDSRLRDVISTKRSGLLSFLTRNDIYDEDKLRADEEALRRYYFNRGYADFRVISSQAEFDESRNTYNIFFVVEEGQRYRFGAIDVESTVEGLDPDALRREVATREGSWYSAEDVEESIVGLSERAANLGYAFAQVTPRGDRNFENQTISVVYSIDQGPRAYVERIEIRGNSKTRDHVIRREFDIAEGDAFNQVLIRRAKKRLEDLDFFATVEVSTIPGSQPDQVILVVDVVEKSTGELSIGGGYTTGSGPNAGFGVEGSVSERNFLGRGQSIRLSIAGGSNSRDFTLSFTEPYFLGQRISAGFDLYRQTRDYTTYKSELTGGTVRFGLPITQALTAQVAYNYSVETYKFAKGCAPNGLPAAGCNLSPYLDTAIKTQSPWTKSSVSGTLIYNTIDDMRNPRDGTYVNLTAEVAGLGGTARFVKFTGRGTHYRTLVDDLDLVGLVTVGGGHISALGGGGVRLFDNFQSNDRMIRGFRYNGIGPYDTVTGDHLGGKTYFNASAEMQFPLPLLSEGLGFKGAVFADAATLFGTDLAGVNPIGSTASAWRASVGASVLWASPFGPLRVDYAVPVLSQTGDLIQNFSFGISTRF